MQIVRNEESRTRIWLLRVMGRKSFDRGSCIWVSSSLRVMGYKSLDRESCAWVSASRRREVRRPRATVEIGDCIVEPDQENKTAGPAVREQLINQSCRRRMSLGFCCCNTGEIAPTSALSVLNGFLTTVNASMASIEYGCFESSHQYLYPSVSWLRSAIVGGGAHQSQAKGSSAAYYVIDKSTSTRPVSFRPDTRYLPPTLALCSTLGPSVPKGRIEN
jgi:hypothetical protein